MPILRKTAIDLIVAGIAGLGFLLAGMLVYWAENKWGRRRPLSGKGAK